jgi:hypothetical protein
LNEPANPVLPAHGSRSCRNGIRVQLGLRLTRFQFCLARVRRFGGITARFLATSLHKITPSLEPVLRELECLQSLHLRLGIDLALEDRNHTGGPEGAHVVTNDRVRTAQFVVDQKSSILPASAAQACSLLTANRFAEAKAPAIRLHLDEYFSRQSR